MVHLKKVLSEQLGIGIGTIYQTILEYKRSKTISSPNRTKKFINVKDKVDDFDKYAIRRKIHKFWCDREFPTLDKILQVVNEDEDLPDFSRTSMYRLVKSMDFVYVKQGRNSALIEKTEIVDWRRRYLRAYCDIERRVGQYIIWTKLGSMLVTFHTKFGAINRSNQREMRLQRALQPVQ
ncbi:unnamed protein product [Macrosiphum euphorbiae]|uniref:Uncharacterized protein n=1 Tax=Macrosiphum euphorbiae TaxID=13131 RepID=A0AAV0XMJ2_9HEMI|nr:unnamed protein product [Macrosiphum euphorbiae]